LGKAQENCGGKVQGGRGLNQTGFYRTIKKKKKKGEGEKKKGSFQRTVNPPHPPPPTQKKGKGNPVREPKRGSCIKTPLEWTALEGKGWFVVLSENRNAPA